MNIRKLNVAIDNFDSANSFNVEVQGRSGVLNKKCSLRRDFVKQGDGILWALSSGAVLKDVYSDADIAERQRLNSESALKHGDIVEIEGSLYKVRVKGNYSDCAIFDPV